MPSETPLLIVRTPLFRLVDQSWQMLPVGPTGYGNSPYSALSAFAGDPLLISLERLAAEGLLPRGGPFVSQRT